MSALREWARRAWSFITRRDDGGAVRELGDELRFHLEMAEARLRRSGLSADEARREARRELGGVAQITEAYRDQRSLPWLETFVQDVRYGARTLKRTPAFTAAALLTLALGIGANTAIFSVVNAVVLQPLPYAAPDRLVAFGDEDSDGLPSNIGYTTWQDYRDKTRTFESLAAIRSWQPTLVADGEAERMQAMRVSWNYFEMLGVRPALGRTFAQHEDRPEHWRVLVMSDGLWRRRFGADPGVIGRTVRMNDRDYRIIGVLPADYEPLISQHFYKSAEMWAALGYDTTLNYACRSCQHLRALGRVREGTSLPQAAAELTAIRTQLAQQYPNDYARGNVGVVSLEDKLAGPVRGTLFMLLAAAGFVLLIACANVANLLLARSMHRSREMVVRAALGAGRGRLLRQLLTESTLLGLAGGVVGVALAALSVGTIVELAPVSLPRLDRVGIDAWVLGFAFVVSVATGALFGAVPAWRAARPNLQTTLATDSRTSTGGGQLARRLLVVGDLALALVLLAGAGLMLKSVERLMQVNPGFDSSGVLTLQYSLVGAAYAEDAAVSVFNDRVVERVRTVPGVEAAAVAGQIPMGGNGDTWGFHIDGRLVANTAESPDVERYSVTPDYFAVMRVPLRSGRLFTEADRATSLPVIVVSESTARALWPGESPIGHRVRTGDATSGPWRTVIGVAGDVRHTGLDTAATLQMYMPQAQLTDSFLVLTVRTTLAAPERLASEVRRVLRELDPTVPVYDVALLTDLVGRSAAQRRFVMQLLGGFAVLALVLAAIGLYGVVSYTVAQRTREVGVRISLGARRTDIFKLVLGSGMTTVATGLTAGVAASLLLARFMDTVLFDVSATDPATLAGAVTVLAAVAIAAHIIPARRALRVDPVLALRRD